MNDDLLRAAVNAADVITGVYEWLDRVDAAGGATSISGISACNAMLKSLRSNRKRCETLVMAPLAKAIAEANAK